jgi:putative hydrolase of the HAD superfamily
MIKAVIFDWGDVIAPNPNGGWLDVLADLLDDTTASVLPHWKAAGYSDFTKGLIDEATFWRQFERSYGRPLPQDVSRVWIEGGALLPWPEMIAFVKELKEQGLSVALLSNTVNPMTVIARKTALYEDFDIVILSNEVGLRKPDPAIYQSVLDELQLTASECVYVDDLPANLEPAAAMGVITVLAYENPNRTIADVRVVIS